MNESINIWPYIQKALILKRKKRKGFGNMFRHQMETFSILIEYGYEDPILLKASIIHDLLEDGVRFEEISSEDIIRIDSDGKEVAEVVNEVTQRIVNGIEEPKKEFLLRIMQQASTRAKTLKLADRIANVSSLVDTNNEEFISRYLKETEGFVLPFASDINPEMEKELKSIIHKNNCF